GLALDPAPPPRQCRGPFGCVRAAAGYGTRSARAPRATAGHERARGSVVISFRRRKPQDDMLSGADALAAAETLAENGRRLEAIDLLTEANRFSRDAAIEERLVRLRHGAFDELPRVAGLPEWPPEAPDLFPGARLPEVKRAEFSTETLRSGILRHG